jgi:hypothetical protein
MENTAVSIVERIQALAAKTLATQPAGHQLHLIGGFRYRRLDGSCRASVDIDYHWEGDLDKKQAEIVEVLRKRFLPEVKRQFGYDGDIHAAIGPDAESPAVRIVKMAFYRWAEAGSRVEIPLEITHIPRLDPPVVRTVGGTVVLTVSDADMIESKVLALLNRTFTQARDIVDIFLFQDSLRPDAPGRLSHKFGVLSLSPAEVRRRLSRLRGSASVHVREIERVLQTQVDPTVAANLRVAGGAAMIWEQVMGLLSDRLTGEETTP